MINLVDAAKSVSQRRFEWLEKPATYQYNQNTRQKKSKKTRLGEMLMTFPFMIRTTAVTITFTSFLIGSQIRDVEIANSQALQIEATIMSILKLS